LAKCEDETHTPKVGDLESSETPEFLEFDSKGQNTSPWGVLGVIGKVLKFKCPKWPRIGHLDIFSPSYGQKKGRESTRSYKSGIDHYKSGIDHYKSGIDPLLMCDGGVQHGVGKLSKRATSLVQTSSRSEVGAKHYDVPKSRESKTGTISRLHFGSPGKKCHLDASATKRHREYYRKDGGGTSRARAVVCHVSPS
jgi:hypothetical protein